jgi:SHS2 domain-containing protein
MPFRIIDHTADFGLQIFGKDLNHLFRNAGCALFDQIVDAAAVTGDASMRLSVSGEDHEELMFNWLRELLYLWNGEQKLIRDLHIDRLSSGRLDARFRYDRYAQDRHPIKRDIKAVTYHQLQVRRWEGGWMAQVIFDV